MELLTFSVLVAALFRDFGSVDHGAPIEMKRIVIDGGNFVATAQHIYGSAHLEAFIEVRGRGNYALTEADEALRSLVENNSDLPLGLPKDGLVQGSLRNQTVFLFIRDIFGHVSWDGICPHSKAGERPNSNPVFACGGGEGRPRKLSLWKKVTFGVVHAGTGSILLAPVVNAFGFTPVVCALPTLASVLELGVGLGPALIATSALSLVAGGSVTDQVMGIAISPWDSEAFRSAAAVAAFVYPFWAAPDPEKAKLLSGIAYRGLFNIVVLTQPALVAQFAQSGTALLRLGGVGAGMVRFGVKISGTKGAESVAGLVALVCPFLMPSRSIEEILLHLLVDFLDRLLDGLECSSSSSDAAPQVPDDVPGAFAFNSRWYAGATPSRDFTKPAPPLHELSLRTKLWLIGVSITGKAVDYAECPDGPEVGRSLLEGRLLGGGKRYYCDVKGCTHKGSFKTGSGLASHIRSVHTNPQPKRPDPIPAPTELGFKPDPKGCPSCSGAPKVNGYGTCRYWGKSGHLGSDDVEQARAAYREKKNAVRDWYYEQEKEQGVTSKNRPDDPTDWDSPAHGNRSETKAKALKDFIDATPDWRNVATFLPRLAAHLFDLATLGDEEKERLAGPHGLIYTRCCDEDPLKPNTLPRKDGSSNTYEHLAEVVQTLLGEGDAGKLALLKLLVASKLLAALEPLMSGEMRRIFANNRTNARGPSCSRELALAARGDGSGVFRLRALVLKLAALQFESDGGDNMGFARYWQNLGGFGLRTSKADLIRLTERLAYVCQMLTPEQGSRPGCDFGTLYALTQIFQAFAVKEEGDELAGDKWHRKENRDQSASMYEAVGDLLNDGTASSFDLAIMLNLGHVVLFKSLDTSNLQASLATVFQFFSETYDTISGDKTTKAYAVRAREAVHGRADCGGGIPTALDGYDVAYRINKGIVGHDPFGKDERDAEIIAALARNLERLCWGFPWDVSRIAGREWGGTPELRELREQLLKKLMPLADRASKIFHVEFERQIAEAGDNIEAVLAAVRAGWDVMTEGLDSDRDNYFWENDQVFFGAGHARRLLAELSQPRQVRVVTHDLSQPNWRENGVVREHAFDRIGYEFGRVFPTSAPAAGGALKPANSPKHEAKRRRV